MNHAVVVTVSTRAAAGVYADEAGPALVARLRAAGFRVEPPTVVPDGLQPVRESILAACGACDLIVTSGGTGIHPEDVTPEATLAVVDRTIPGLAERMRAVSAAVTPLAALSRAVVGVRGRTLVVNVPGSPKAAVENLDAVLAVVPHALDQLRGEQHG